MMALQRTTEGKISGHNYTREQATPFAIRQMRAIFESYPPKEQERIRAEVAQRLRDEARSREFAARDHYDRRRGSELARLAWEVYGVRMGD